MQPLRGIRVLDLSRLLPGPFTSLILADLGAQVDKLEDAAGGDPLRYAPPFVGEPGEGVGALFLALNRNKRSISLDLKKQAGQQAFLRMVEHYDVVLEQFRPGVLDRLGLSHATICARNARLIVCALTGYGQTGPLSSRAGHDINYLARAGVLGMESLAGGDSRQPRQPLAIQLADMGGGLWSALAILAALRERDITGKGSVLDIAMVEASMGFAFSTLGRLLAGELPTKDNDLLTGGIAVYGTYLTKDGEVMTLGALEPKFWASFCAGVGLALDASAHALGPHQAELRARVQRIFESRTRTEWEVFSRDHDCCLEPVLRPRELRTDPQLVAREVFFEIESRWGSLGQMRTPVTEARAIHTPPPQYGEHTEVILREAGLDEAQIEALCVARVARTGPTGLTGKAIR